MSIVSFQTKAELDALSPGVSALVSVAFVEELANAGLYVWNAGTSVWDLRPAKLIGANPTATAGIAAVNGTAATFMRSDAAPAIPAATNNQYGLIKLGNGFTVAANGSLNTAGTFDPPVPDTFTILENADNASIPPSLGAAPNGLLIFLGGGRVIDGDTRPVRAVLKPVISPTWTVTSNFHIQSGNIATSDYGIVVTDGTAYAVFGLEGGGDDYWKDIIAYAASNLGASRQGYVGFYYQDPPTNFKVQFDGTYFYFSVSQNGIVWQPTKSAGSLATPSAVYGRILATKILPNAPTAYGIGLFYNYMDDYYDPGVYGDFSPMIDIASWHEIPGQV